MLMIVARHYVSMSGLDLAARPMGVNKVVLEAFVYAGGKVGVVVFFTISAWFLCAGTPSLRAAFRRVWMLELQLLFWSLSLMVLWHAVDPAALDRRTVVRSFAPVSTDLWWYATSYVLFLVAMPFVMVGLRALGRRWHLVLCLVTFTGWSVVAGLLPGVRFDMVDQSVFNFLYLFTLVTYVRWYRGLPGRRTGWWLVGAGVGVSLAWTIAVGLIARTTGHMGDLQVLAVSEAWRLPCVLAGFGMFVVAANRRFSSSPVDVVARSTFAVYLISTYPPATYVLWKQLFPLERMVDSPLLVPYLAAVVVAILMVCVAADLVRRGLFSLGVQRVAAELFDRAWEWASRVLSPRLAPADPS